MTAKDRPSPTPSLTAISTLKGRTEVADRRHLHLDRRGLAVCRRRAGPDFPARHRLVHEGGREYITGHGRAARGRLAASEVLRAAGPLGPGAQYTSAMLQRLLLGPGITYPMGRMDNVYATSAMESFLSSLKTEPTARKAYRKRNAASADLFDHTKRVHNPRRRQSKPSYRSPKVIRKRAMHTYTAIYQTRSRPNASSVPPVQRCSGIVQEAPLVLAQWTTALSTSQTRLDYCIWA